jgi:acyl carrier protein
MTHAEIELKVMQALTSVAPEADAATIRSDGLLRDQVDLDSMDFLRFIVELHKVTGVEVPEADYPRLDTVSHARDYLAARLGQSRVV